MKVVSEQNVSQKTARELLRMLDIGDMKLPRVGKSLIVCRPGVSTVIRISRNTEKPVFTVAEQMP